MIIPNVRVIPKLEVKGENLIKGMHLEGLRIVGKPEQRAVDYYRDGADELIYIDLVASLYQRDNFLHIVEKTAEQVFIPMTVGGGVRSVDDARAFLRAGADKVSINTAIINNPKLISEIANTFGAQCMVASLEVQKKIDGGYECYTDCGRTPTGKDPFEWAKMVVELGAGEILLTSINQDGTFGGYDLDLVVRIASSVRVPVIASGGAGKLEDFEKVIQVGRADAICASAFFHFKRGTIQKVKDYLDHKKIPVRLI